jgi:hypothetical protein
MNRRKFAPLLGRCVRTHGSEPHHRAGFDRIGLVTHRTIPTCREKIG